MESTSSSLRKNLSGNRKKITPYGDKETIGGRNSLHDLNDRVGRLAGFHKGYFHGQFDELNSPSGTYQKRIPLASPIKRPRQKGQVGPEPDWSVRASYIPLGLCHTIHEYYPSVYRKIWSADHYDKIDPVYFAKTRPPKGFQRMNTHWTDYQVKAWTNLCLKIGIQYSGVNHYNVPQKYLGYYKHGEHYVTPLRKFLEKGNTPIMAEDMPRWSKRGQRSSLSKTMRSLRKVKKLVINPIDVSNILVTRCSVSSSSLKKMYDPMSGLTRRQFKDSFPTVLTLNTNSTLQVSPFILRTLRKLFSRVSRFDPKLPWVYKEAFKPLPIRIVEPIGRKAFSRLRAVYNGRNEAYVLRSAIDNRHLAVGKPHYNEVLEALGEIQAKLDSDGESYDGPVSFTLGGWYD